MSRSQVKVIFRRIQGFSIRLGAYSVVGSEITSPVALCSGLSMLLYCAMYRFNAVGRDCKIYTSSSLQSFLGDLCATADTGTHCLTFLLCIVIVFQRSCCYYCQCRHQHVCVLNVAARRLLCITTHCSTRCSTNAVVLCLSQSSVSFKRRRCFLRWETRHFLARTLMTLWPTSVRLYKGMPVVNASYFGHICCLMCLILFGSLFYLMYTDEID